MDCSSPITPNTQQVAGFSVFFIVVIFCSSSKIRQYVL